MASNNTDTVVNNHPRSSRSPSELEYISWSSSPVSSSFRPSSSGGVDSFRRSTSFYNLESGSRSAERLIQRLSDNEAVRTRAYDNYAILRPLKNLQYKSCLPSVCAYIASQELGTLDISWETMRMAGGATEAEASGTYRSARESLTQIRQTVSFESLVADYRVSFSDSADVQREVIGFMQLALDELRPSIDRGECTQDNAVICIFYWTLLLFKERKHGRIVELETLSEDFDVNESTILDLVDTLRPKYKTLRAVIGELATPPASKSRPKRMHITANTVQRCRDVFRTMPQDESLPRKSRASSHTAVRRDTPAPPAMQARKKTLKRSRREHSVISISSSSDGEGQAKRQCPSDDSGPTSSVARLDLEPLQNPLISIPLPRSKKSRFSVPMLQEDNSVSSQRQNNDVKDETKPQDEEPDPSPLRNPLPLPLPRTPLKTADNGSSRSSPFPSASSHQVQSKHKVAQKADFPLKLPRTPGKTVDNSPVPVTTREKSPVLPRSPQIAVKDDEHPGSTGALDIVDSPAAGQPKEPELKSPPLPVEQPPSSTSALPLPRSPTSSHLPSPVTSPVVPVLHPTTSPHTSPRLPVASTSSSLSQRDPQHSPNRSLPKVSTLSMAQRERNLDVARNQTDNASAAIVAYVNAHGCADTILNFKIVTLRARRDALRPLRSRGHTALQNSVLQNVKLRAQAVAIEQYVRQAEEDIVRYLEQLDEKAHIQVEDADMEQDVDPDPEVDYLLRMKILELKFSLDKLAEVSSGQIGGRSSS